MEVRIIGSENNDSPRGVTPWEAYSACVEINTPQGEREVAKDAKFGEIGTYDSLRSWRLGAKIFLEVVLVNISKETI